MKALRFCFLFVALVSFVSCSLKKESVYMFSYFKDNGQDGLYLAFSHDGYNWKPLNGGKSIVKPEVGSDKLMRDPCIIMGPNDIFHMVWTTSWKDRGIGYAYSKDLVNWSEQIFIPVMEHEPDAKNCWAPELFYDRETDQYLIFWATTIPGRFPETDYQNNTGEPKKGNNHRMYYTTTRDFKTFSKTKLFYDHGFNVIDATIIKAGAEYIMFLKDETNKPFVPQKNLRIAKSRQAIGSYSKPSEPITGNYWAEGPTVIKMGDKWHLYFDKYRLGKYGLLTSIDLKTWVDESESLSLPEGIRHGTVFKVPLDVINNFPK